MKTSILVAALFALGLTAPVFADHHEGATDAMATDATAPAKAKGKKMAANKKAAKAAKKAAKKNAKKATTTTTTTTETAPEMGTTPTEGATDEAGM